MRMKNTELKLLVMFYNGYNNITTLSNFLPSSTGAGKAALDV